MGRMPCTRASGRPSPPYRASVDLSGLPDRRGVGTGTHFPDHVPNPGHALVGLLASLIHRARTGQGQAIEVSQLESTINAIGPAVVSASLEPGPTRRAGNRAPDSSPRGVFPVVGEDLWIAITCRTDANWANLADVLGHPEWASDPQFLTLADRKQHEDALECLIADATRPCDRLELVAELRGRGVPAAAVNTSRDVLEDPDLVARGYWQRIDHPVIGAFSVTRPPFRFGLDGRPDVGRPPLLGEHTHEIARDLLGMSDERIRELVDEGVLA